MKKYAVDILPHPLWILTWQFFKTIIFYIFTCVFGHFVLSNQEISYNILRIIHNTFKSLLS